MVSTLELWFEAVVGLAEKVTVSNFELAAARALFAALWAAAAAAAAESALVWAAPAAVAAESALVLAPSAADLAPSAVDWAALARLSALMALDSALSAVDFADAADDDTTLDPPKAGAVRPAARTAETPRRTRRLFIKTPMCADSENGRPGQWWSYPSDFCVLRH